MLAKVLANKLKKVVGKVVSDFQHSFIEGRQILTILIASETIDSRSKSNLFGLVLNMDIKKAYDHAN